jgi:hypothetical protein
MREHDLYLPIIAHAQTEGVRLWRVNDCPAMGKAPFDLTGVGPPTLGRTCGAIAVAAEVKVVRGREGVRPDDCYLLTSDFEAQQVGWLRVYAEAGALAVAMVYFEDAKRMFYARLEPEYFAKNRLFLTDIRSTFSEPGSGWAANTLPSLLPLF